MICFCVSLCGVLIIEVGVQWWIYDTFKATMGMGTTGGK